LLKGYKAPHSVFRDRGLGLLFGV